MSTEQFDLTNFTPFLLNRAGTHVAAKFSEILKSYDIDITTWRLLASLYQHDMLRIGQLAEFTSIEMWTVSRALTKLEERKLVVREREGQDARAVTVHLTRAGKRLVSQIVPEAQQFEEVPLVGFSAAETKQLRRMLRKLYDNIVGLEEKKG